MKTRIGVTCLLALAVWVVAPFAQNRPLRPLEIYVIDVEGGNAVLFATPNSESLLIDTGNSGTTRDVDRIMNAVNAAGLSSIDYLITTHYHGDHVGGIVELAARIPIRHFIDHGANVQPNPAIDKLLQQYAEIHAKVNHVVAKPGDKIPLIGLDVRVLTSAGEAIKTNLPGGGKPNPLCASFKPKDPDTTENAQSVGALITYGRFRVVHLGDLTWNKEFELMCPTNRIGTVDLFIVSHHGLDISNSEALVHALRPRVAVMNNGIRKGGMPDTMKVLYAAPGLESLWQLHFSLLGGTEYAPPGVFIANLETESAHEGPANWIKATAQPDGTFTVTNSRNGFAKVYASRAN